MGERGWTSNVEVPLSICVSELKRLYRQDLTKVRPGKIFAVRRKGVVPVSTSIRFLTTRPTKGRNFDLFQFHKQRYVQPGFFHYLLLPFILWVTRSVF